MNDPILVLFEVHNECARPLARFCLRLGDTKKKKKDIANNIVTEEKLARVRCIMLFYPAPLRRQMQLTCETSPGRKFINDYTGIAEWFSCCSHSRPQNAEDIHTQVLYLVIWSCPKLWREEQLSRRSLRIVFIVQPIVENTDLDTCDEQNRGHHMACCVLFA